MATVEGPFHGPIPGADQTRENGAPIKENWTLGPGAI